MYHVSRRAATGLQAVSTPPCLSRPLARCPPLTALLSSNSYRRSTRPPGERLHHPGLAADYAPGGSLADIESRAFGVPGVEDNLWRTQELPGDAQQIIIDNKERVYYSHRREVLGKTFVRGYDLPKASLAARGAAFPPPPPPLSLPRSHTRSRPPRQSDDPRGVAYGKSTATNDAGRITGKSMVTPSALDLDAPINEDQNRHKQQYIKSHNSYDPAEQVNRNYVYPATITDPANFTFGVGVGSHKSLNL